MKTLKWLAIAMFLVISLTAATPYPFTPSNAFREACELSRYSCRHVPAPYVRYSSIVREAGAYGIYAGGSTIWIAPGLEPELEYAVLVHETVHYLQNTVDGLKIPFKSKFTQCVAEEEAFEISDIVARRLGANELVRNGNLESYGCTA
jgi:hypothetical protein